MGNPPSTGSVGFGVVVTVLNCGPSSTKTVGGKLERAVTVGSCMLGVVVGDTVSVAVGGGDASIINIGDVGGFVNRVVIGASVVVVDVVVVGVLIAGVVVVVVVVAVVVPIVVVGFDLVTAPSAIVVMVPSVRAVINGVPDVIDAETDVKVDDADPNCDCDVVLSELSVRDDVEKSLVVVG